MNNLTENKAFRGDRLHIAILGRCNTGKSSLLNCITGQEAAIVSPEPGTTGDPLPLGFELLPLGPVTFYDTAGLDESSELGILRQKAGRKALTRCDLALVVTDEAGIGPWEEEIIQALQALGTPFLVIFNKEDLWREGPCSGKAAQGIAWCEERGITHLRASMRERHEPGLLREAIIAAVPPKQGKKPLLTDLLEPGQLVVLVTPIDASAPVGRLIAPQVQCLRELVEYGCPALVLQPGELPGALKFLKTPPALVVADSQAIKQVAAIIPESIPLTSFSIALARQKGDFELLLEGARTINKLAPDAKILIAEACSHHIQNDDIARVKIPALLRERAGNALSFFFCGGGDFPDNLGDYTLVIHCGGCMLNPGEMRRRIRICAAAGVPATNFGMAIFALQGLLERGINPFNQASPLCNSADV